MHQAILDTKITDVTVYTGRARVTRTGEIALEAGETTLMLLGLPQQIESDSIRVSGRGAGVTIRGVDVKPDVQTEDNSTSKQALLDEKAQLSDKKNALNNQWSVLKNHINYLKTIANNTGEKFGKALINPETSLERVGEVADYLNQQLAEAFEQNQTFSDQIDDLIHQIEEIDARLTNNAQPRRVQRGKAVHIAVDAESGATFEFSVDYVLLNATWYPVYDLRLSADNEVELTYQAQISQHSNETWQDVNLTLSTASVSSQRTLPELEPMLVSNRVVQPNIMRRERVDNYMADEVAEAQMMPKSAMALGGVASSAPAPVAKVQQATVDSNESGTSVSFKVATPITISGDGESHKTTIVITKLGVDLDYLTTPTIEEVAFLRATVTNTSDYTLLPGDVSIFHVDDFVGRTRIETIAPNEEFEVQLGQAERIKVSRELVNTDTSKQRFIGNRQYRTLIYETTVQNLLDKQAKVTLKDRYPKSDVSEITVKLDDSTTTPNDETDMHILTWEVTLKPNEKRVIRLAYTLEYNGNITVYGLE